MKLSFTAWNHKVFKCQRLSVIFVYGNVRYI